MRHPGIPHPGGERSAMKRIDILPSKSAAHRMLIAAALCEEPCDVILSERSLDIEATENCLAEIRRVRKEGATSEENGEAAEEAQLHCGESGSTFRFLIPLVAALGMDAKFYPEGRLSQRPLSPLVEELEKKGVTFSPLGANPFHVKGQLEPGAFRIPGNVSSQYITGLMMALPLLADDSTIRVTGERQSMGYVNLTLQVLREFGIEIITERMGEELVYRIPGNQKYRSPGTCKVEGDWSNAAFWLTAGVLGKEAVQVTGLNPNSAQGDRKIVELLRRFGAKIEVQEDTVTAYPSGTSLHGIIIDASQIPDMVPALALVASAANGTTEIRHAERLRLKESDRLMSVTEVLNALGGRVEERPDGLVITGRDVLSGGRADGYNDHRIVMMAAIASLITTDKVIMTGSAAVNKSYPTFFTVLEENKMGNNLERR